MVALRLLKDFYNCSMSTLHRGKTFVVLGGGLLQETLRSKL